MRPSASATLTFRGRLPWRRALPLALWLAGAAAQATDALPPPRLLPGAGTPAATSDARVSPVVPSTTASAATAPVAPSRAGASAPSGAAAPGRPASDAARPPCEPLRIESNLPGEARIEHRCVEDAGARIDETRVRGATRRIVVQPARGAAWEVLPPDAGRDPTQRTAPAPRVWPVLTF